MSTAAKLTVFAVGLMVVFFASLGVGAAVGPTKDAPGADHNGHATTTVDGQ